MITNSTFDGNRAQYVGGGVYGDASIIVRSSTFTNNCAQYGGAIEHAIGESRGGSATIVNSTVTANTQSQGDSALGFFSDDGATIAYSTIVGNVNDENSTCDLPVSTDATDHSAGGSRGPAVRDQQVDDSANLHVSHDLTIFGTVITGAVGGENCVVDGTATSNGWNYADDTSCGFTNTANGDHQASGNDPMLGALGDNGGPTPTMLPQTGSPLIDAIPNAACQTDPAPGVTTDQRALPRPEQAGGLCDIGAVEVQAPPPAESPTVVVLQPKFTG
jgi:hypothetical protein